MVSFRSALSSSKKRKLEKAIVLLDDEDQDVSDKPPPMAVPKKASEILINVGSDTALSPPGVPLEWQRCLNMKTGKIYYQNTIASRKQAGSDGHHQVNLDLDLNLPCGTDLSHVGDNFMKTHNHHPAGKEDGEFCKNYCFGRNDDKSTVLEGGMARSPSWLEFGGDQREMITAACKKCHMLVLMFKSSPSCPNCKFMHSPSEQVSPTDFLSGELSLSC